MHPHRYERPTKCPLSLTPAFPCLSPPHKNAPPSALAGCRWFVGSGINDTFIASPALYDVDTGEHVRLDPCNASGRTLLAVSEGVSSSSPQHARSSRSSRRVRGGDNTAGLSTSKNAFSHTRRREEERLFHRYRHRRRRRDTAPAFGDSDGQDSRLELSLPRTNVCPSGDPSAIRRSASDGSLCRSTQAADVPKTAGDGIVVGPAKQCQCCECLGANSITGDSGVALGRKYNSAREVAERQQRLHREREDKKAEEEEQRRRETEHANAKAVACRLAYRVLCRARRTRVLVLALWRWRLHASKLRLQQDMEEKRGREHKQVKRSRSVMRKESIVARLAGCMFCSLSLPFEQQVEGSPLE